MFPKALILPWKKLNEEKDVFQMKKAMRGEMRGFGQLISAFCEIPFVVESFRCP